jgi:cysteinyl-tRNA synthetase
MATESIRRNNNSDAADRAAPPPLRGDAKAQMSLRIYNSLTRQKELFQPVAPGKVGMYLCGPTVYKPPHIGHMVGPIIFDAVKRYLAYKGFDVTWVVNITDVDDKLIDAAAEQGTAVAALAERYTSEYHECLAALGVDTIDRFPKASEHMPEIIRMCQTLIDKGFAYAADGNVWFDVVKDQDYGKLSHRRPEEQESGARSLEGSGKRSPADFAVWKAAKPGEPMWDSPWGRGRPGWHIECSAMSSKYLGETFDIHGGGMDLMFPHHENELAQSESATGKTFVKYWLHNGLTRFNTKKISGSDAKTEEGRKVLSLVAARKLIGDYGPELLRYTLLSTHYRSPIDFSEDVIASSKKGLTTFHRLFERVERLTGQPLPDKGPDMDTASRDLLEVPPVAGFVRDVLSFKMKFLEMMDDDFNTAGAIAVLHELAGATNALIESSRVEKSKSPESLQAITAAAQTAKNLGQLLGLFRFRPEPPREVGRLTDGLMTLLTNLRNDARKTKNFALADAIRKGLTELGVTLEDRPDGTGWRKE